MSKNKKYLKNAAIRAEAGSSAPSFEQEFIVVKHDLLRVLMLNAVYLAAVLAVYFTNQKSHYLEKLFTKIFHF